MENNAKRSPTIQQLFSLKGKTVLISGGAGLLGSEISFAMAESGANVIIASRNEARCKERAEEIKAANPDIKAWGIGLDITKKDSIKSCFEQIKALSPKLDVLVNCSGFGKKNTFESITEEDWREDVEISPNAPFMMIKGAFPLLQESKGNIINIASMYGHIAPDYRMYDGKKYANPPSYGVCKAGILQMTRYLASFLSPHGIRVNAISPGPFPYESTQKENPAFIERLAAKNPLNRIGNPHEIKGAAIFLASNASTYITGENICVDGGWTIW